MSGQQTPRDSLEQLLQSAENDVKKADLYNQLAYEWYAHSIPTSRKYAKQSIRLSQQKKYIKGEATAWYRMTFIHNSEGKLDSAIQAIELSSQLALMAKDSVLYANALTKKGSLLSERNEDDSAIDFLLEALKIGELLSNLSVSSNAANEVGRLFMGLGNVNESIKYLEKSLEFAEKIPDDRKIFRGCLNLSIAHDSVDIIRKYLKRAVALAQQDNFTRELTYAYNSMGMLHYYELDQVDSSLYYKKLALSRAKEAQDSALIYMIMHSIAEVYKPEDLDSAEHYYTRLINYFNIQTYDHVKDHNLRDLAQIKFEKQEYKIAFELLDSSYTLAKARYYDNMESKVADANTLYETEKKEAEIMAQSLTIERQKNSRNIILILASLLLGILAFVAQYMINRQKRSKREAELALQLEQERAEDLRELSEAKDNLFNNVSHELRTPLTMIIGPLQDASQEIKNIPVKEHVDLALLNSKRLANLVNEILDLSKLDTQKLELEKQEFPLLAFLKRVYGSFSSLAASRQIIMEDNLDTTQLNTLSVMTDPGKLETIFYNLISNSIKYSKGGDTIRLNLDYDQLEQNLLTVTVEDEGLGIEEEDQKQIFDRYFQAKNAVHASGTGIGLALTKELCKLLGGSISVQSQLGKGSQFTFSIPIEQKRTVPTAPTESMDEPKEELKNVPFLISGYKPSVLLVEDDLVMAEYLKKILSRQFDCTLAYNGVQAISTLKKQSFDLISSDVMMPEMDGFEFRQQINKDPRLKNTPFILLTARNLPEDRLKGFQLGVDDYLVKPFNPEELKARVLNLIKNKISREEADESSSNTAEEKLLEQLRSTVESNLDDPEFKVTDLAERINYSPRQLGRILKKLTGLSSVEFILEIRMQRAYQLLKSGRFHTINEVRYQIGIESPSYFSQKFKNRFGVNPKDLL